MNQKLLLAVCICALIAASARVAVAQTRLFGNGPLPLYPAVDPVAAGSGFPGDVLPRNFGAIDPPQAPVIMPIGYGAPNLLIRPWYVAPYRYYSYYRPWYTFGYYGPTYPRYHYAPSWGYPPLPYYAPPYLSPAGYDAPDYTGCYYW